jgi:lipopolysaccharide biosynthesis glycosyltransferase
MFHQGLLAIETIRIHCPLQYEICVLALDLKDDELAMLSQQGINLFTDYRSLRTYPNAPLYSQAMTCRPWLCDIFPGYELYMWIDADVRFCDHDAFHFYLRNANANRGSIVICREIDSLYGFLCYPPLSRAYFTARYKRLLQTYGKGTADYQHYLIPFNAGIFAMHKECPTWKSYRRNLELAMQGNFHHFSEQDAMNVAIVQDKMNVIAAPTIMNWLCSNAVPAFNQSSQRFVRPEFPFLPISVLHLTNSFDVHPALSIPFYELYQQLKLTK